MPLRKERRDHPLEAPVQAQTRSPTPIVHRGGHEVARLGSVPGASRAPVFVVGGCAAKPRASHPSGSRPWAGSPMAGGPGPWHVSRAAENRRCHVASESRSTEIWDPFLGLMRFRALGARVPCAERGAQALGCPAPSPPRPKSDQIGPNRVIDAECRLLGDKWTCRRHGPDFRV